MSKRIVEQQLQVCARLNALAIAAPPNLKVGINRNVTSGVQPINALRIAPEGDTSGWYIWAGEEWSDSPEFFVPLHIEHLSTCCPQIVPYLQLPPGWRVLIAQGYEDVWFDPQLQQHLFTQKDG